MALIILIGWSLFIIGLLLQGIGIWRVSDKWGKNGKGWTIALLSLAYIFVVVGFLMLSLFKTKTAVSLFK